MWPNRWPPRVLHAVGSLGGGSTIVHSVKFGQQIVSSGGRGTVTVTAAVAVSVSVSMAMAVRLVRTCIYSNKAARRLLRGLRVCLYMCLSRMARATIHQCYIGRAQWTYWRGRARGCSSVKNRLLTPLQSVVELSCASSN